MHRLTRTIDRYWFAEAPAQRLALLRLLVGGFALWYLGQRVDMFSRMAEETDPTLFAPVGVAAFLNEPMPAEWFRIIVLATLGLNVLFVLGAGHRLAGPLFAGFLLFTLCYRNSWSMIYHSDNVMVFHVLILGLTPAADAWSVDAWRRNRPAPKSGWQYGWPIRLMGAVTVATYFLCGVAKVAGPLGWSWGMGEALRGQVAVDALRKELLGDGGPELAFQLYEHVWLFTVLGVGTLILELGAPLALANKRLGYVWAVNAFLMHWGIYYIMDITFRYCLSGVIFASFFELERVFAWVRPPLRVRSGQRSPEKPAW